MNKELRDKWVAALRSGEFKQCTGQLELNGCYCCLGVLNVVGDLGCDGYSGFLRAYVGSEYTYHPVSKNQQTLLSRMNDTDHNSFTEIADWIEQNIEVTP